MVEKKWIKEIRCSSFAKHSGFSKYTPFVLIGIQKKEEKEREVEYEEALQLAKKYSGLILNFLNFFSILFFKYFSFFSAIFYHELSIDNFDGSREFIDCISRVCVYNLIKEPKKVEENKKCFIF